MSTDHDEGDGEERRRPPTPADGRLPAQGAGEAERERRSLVNQRVSPGLRINTLHFYVHTRIFKNLSKCTVDDRSQVSLLVKSHRQRQTETNAAALSGPGAWA